MTEGTDEDLQTVKLLQI